MENCGSKEYCGNNAYYRAIQTTEEALGKRLESRKTASTGEGLFTLQGLNKCDVVCEYVGNILSRTEYEKKQRSRILNDRVAALPDGRYVDAAVGRRLCGFVNHSCVPNCVMMCRKFSGLEHVFIVAAKDIGADKELLINYCGDRKVVKLPFSHVCDICVPS